MTMSKMAGKTYFKWVKSNGRNMFAETNYIHYVGQPFIQILNHNRNTIHIGLKFYTIKKNCNNPKANKKNWATPCWADQDPAIFCVHMVWLASNLSVAVEVIIRRVSVGQSTFLLWESSYQITWKSLKTNILETIWHVSKPTARIYYIYMYVLAKKWRSTYIYTYICMQI